jgi:hypothetical protein
VSRLQLSSFQSSVSTVDSAGRSSKGTKPKRGAQGRRWFAYRSHERRRYVSRIGSSPDRAPQHAPPCQGDVNWPCPVESCLAQGSDALPAPRMVGCSGPARRATECRTWTVPRPARLALRTESSPLLPLRELRGPRVHPKSGLPRDRVCRIARGCGGPLSESGVPTRLVLRPLLDRASRQDSLRRLVGNLVPDQRGSKDGPRARARNAHRFFVSEYSPPVSTIQASRWVARTIVRDTLLSHVRHIAPRCVPAVGYGRTPVLGR